MNPRWTIAVAGRSRQEDVRRHRIMILVTGVDAGAMVEQQPCCRDITGKMQRRTGVTALCVDQRWIVGEHPGEMIGEAETGRRVNRQRCAARDQVSRNHRVHLAGVETGRPPLADRLQVVG